MDIKNAPKDDSLIKALTEVTHEGIREKTPRVGFGKGWSKENRLYNNIRRVVVNNLTGMVFSDLPYAATVNDGHPDVIRPTSGGVRFLKFAKKGIPREMRDVIIAPGTKFAESPVIFTESVRGQEPSHMVEIGILDTFEDRERILDNYMDKLMEGG